jgi:uncharacterized membrane protein
MTATIEQQPVRVRWRRILTWGLAGTIFALSLIFAGRSPVRIEAAAHAQPLHAPDLSLIPTMPWAMQLHLTAIALAVPLGAVMFLSRKGARFHRIAGWTWVGLMLVGSLSPLLALNEPHYGWNYIHLTIPLVLIALIPAVLAARRHQVRRHRAGMIWVYSMLLFAGAGTLAPSRLIWRMFFG